jgi:hypothetical protein
MSPPIAIGSIDFSASQHVDTSKPPLATIDELIRARAEEMGDLPMLGYPNEGLLDFEEHSAKSCDLYADAAAQKLKQLGLSEVVSFGAPCREHCQNGLLALCLRALVILALTMAGHYRIRP